MEGETLEQKLFNRVKPALKSKIKEIKRLGINNISEDFLFEYLKNNIWKQKKNLTLGEIVNDILMCDNNAFIEFLEKSEQK